jgi:hypothetical protein
MIKNPDIASEPASGERRKQPRHARRVAIELLNMGDDPRVPFYQDFVAGETEDISNGGLRVRVPYDVREGTELGVVVRHRDRVHVFLARIIWKIRDESSCQYGLSVPPFETSAFL